MQRRPSASPWRALVVGAITLALAVTAQHARARPGGPADGMDTAGYVGGADADQLDDVSMGDDGQITGGGRTHSDDAEKFIRPEPTPPSKSPGDKDGIVARTFSQRRAGAAASSPGGSTRFARLARADVRVALLGGDADDYVNGTALAADGSVWVVGGTSSADFPVVGGAQPAPGGGNAEAGDAFLARLSSDLARIEYSTFFGGGAWDDGAGIALGPDGGPVIVGLTTSRDFPTRGGSGQDPPCVRGVRNACPDVFVARFTPDGRQVVWSMVLGGQAEDAPNDVAVDAVGRVILVGDTVSRDFPTIGALQARSAGGTCGGSLRRDCREAFVTAIQPDGTGLAWSTYLGGRGDDAGNTVALGRDGIVVAGRTTSTDFPTTAAFQPRPGGGTCQGAIDREPCGDAFVARLTPDGQRLLHGSYLGGRGDDEALGVAVDAAGRVAVIGKTGSRDFPLHAPIQGAFGGGTWDAFFTLLGESGAMVLGTYLGGTEDDVGTGVARSIGTGGAPPGFAVSGSAGRGFPAFNPLTGYNGGDSDAFVGLIAIAAVAPTATPTPVAATAAATAPPSPSPTATLAAPPTTPETRPTLAPRVWLYLPSTGRT